MTLLDLSGTEPGYISAGTPGYLCLFLNKLPAVRNGLCFRQLELTTPRNVLEKVPSAAEVTGFKSLTQEPLRHSSVPGLNRADFVSDLNQTSLFFS